MLDSLKLMNAVALKTDPKDLVGHYAELKLDGMRAKVGKNLDGTIDLQSRSGKTQLGKCPHLEALLEDLEPGTVLDGEFVVFHDTKTIKGLDHLCRPISVDIPDFIHTMKVMGSKPAKAQAKQEALGTKVSLVLFDVLSVSGKMVTGHSLNIRREMLQEIVTETWGDNEHISVSALLTYTTELEDQLIAADAEGLMFKNPSASYTEGGRPKGVWWKYKFVFDSDVIVTGFSPGQGKYEDAIGAVQFGQYQTDPFGDLTLVERGQTSGMSDEIRYDMANNPDSYLGKVMVVTHMGIIKDGFRHPDFKTIRPEGDKTPEECVWE